ncbi:MAG: GNAT family N-acetyltransferase [Verrucomicrobiia bacterium]
MKHRPILSHEDLETYAEAWASCHPEGVSQRVRALAEQNVRQLVLNHSHLYLFEENGQKIGLAGFYFITPLGETMCYIDLVYVFPTCRRQQYGRKIVDFIMSKSNENGVRSYQTWVDIENKISQHLFQKAGFTLAQLNYRRDDKGEPHES